MFSNSLLGGKPPHPPCIFHTHFLQPPSTSTNENFHQLKFPLIIPKNDVSTNKNSTNLLSMNWISTKKRSAVKCFYLVYFYHRAFPSLWLGLGEANAFSGASQAFSVSLEPQNCKVFLVLNLWTDWALEPKQGSLQLEFPGVHFFYQRSALKWIYGFASFERKTGPRVILILIETWMEQNVGEAIQCKKNKLVHFSTFQVG